MSDVVVGRRSPPFEVMFVTPDPGPDLGIGRAGALLSLVRRALAGGVDAIQLRAKGLASGPLFALAAQLIPVCAAHGATLVLNDRLDVALACRAGGIQLGERSLPVAIARQVAASCRVGPAKAPLLIGASVHDTAGVRAAARDGADYLIYGNVFSSASKPGLEGKGLDALSTAVAAAGDCPVVAIGGIDATNAASVRRAGAGGMAVIGAIAGATDPVAAAAGLVAAWRHADGGRR